MVQAAAAGVMRRDIFLAVMCKHHSPPEHVTKLKSPQTAFVNVKNSEELRIQPLLETCNPMTMVCCTQCELYSIILLF